MRIGTKKPTIPRPTADEPSKPAEKTTDRATGKSKARSPSKASRSKTRSPSLATVVEKSRSEQQTWSEFSGTDKDTQTRQTAFRDPAQRQSAPRLAKGLGKTGVAASLARVDAGKDSPQLEQTATATPLASPASSGDSCPVAEGIPGQSDLTPAQQREVEQAVSAIDQSGAEIDRTDGKDARRQATLDAATTLETQLAGKDPAVQAAILEQTQDTIGKIADGLGELDRDQTKQAIGSLTRATESVGRDNAARITDAIAPRLSESLSEHARNLDELGEAISSSIQNGDGALFGAALTNSLQASGETNLAAVTATSTSHGIDAVRKDFEEAQGKADQLDGQLAMVVNDWSGNFSDEAIQEGIGAYREEHSGDYAAAASEAERLASTLEGAGLIQDSREQLEQLPDNFQATPNGYPLPTRATQAADEVFNQLPRLGQTEAGTAAINSAVQRQAAGEPTFLDAANSHGDRLEGDEKTRYQDGLNSAMGRAATLGAEQLAAAGRTDEIPQLMSQYADACGDPAFKQVYAELGAESQQFVDAGYDAAEFSVAFAGAAQKVANKLYPASNPANEAMRGRITSIGAGIATAAFLNDPSIESGLKAGGAWADARFGPQSRVGNYLRGAGVAFDAVDFVRNPSVENGLGVIGSASGLGASLTHAWRGVSGLRGMAAGALGKASLITGLALSAWDTYGAIQRGDAVGAAAAAAPAVGAGIGAAVGALGFGVGAVAGAGVGYAIGSVVQLGINVGQNVFGESPQEKFEKATDDFLRGALEADGLDPDLADRLRDVGGAGGDFAGVGRTLTELAESHGLTGRQLLEALEKMSDSEREKMVKILLEFPTNAEAIAEAQQGDKPADEIPDFEITGDADLGWGRHISEEQFLEMLGLGGTFSSAGGGSW